MVMVDEISVFVGVMCFLQRIAKQMNENPGGCRAKICYYGTIRVGHRYFIGYVLRRL